MTTMQCSKKTGKKWLLACALFAYASFTSAAISLDRTRAIFPGTEKSIALNIGNESSKKPYLAQAWLEDARGNRIVTPFTVSPEIQRLDPGKKSVIRINALPAVASLPQDRESVFYFNVREIPPKSDRPNVLQLAMQTRIKLFYRPAGIVPERFSRHDTQLVLHKLSNGYRIENPTPFFITLIGISGGEQQPVSEGFKALMVDPKSSAVVTGPVYQSPHITTINDFGGKPGLSFQCSGMTCRSSLPANSP